jgi:hypothetical protein
MAVARPSGLSGAKAAEAEAKSLDNAGGHRQVADIMGRRVDGEILRRSGLRRGTRSSAGSDRTSEPPERRRPELQDL